jgi:hypothetical protein
MGDRDCHKGSSQVFSFDFISRQDRSANRRENLPRLLDRRKPFGHEQGTVRIINLRCRELPTLLKPSRQTFISCETVSIFHPSQITLRSPDYLNINVNTVSIYSSNCSHNSIRQTNSKTADFPTS